MGKTLRLRLRSLFRSSQVERELDMAMVLKEAASLFGTALVIGIPTALGFTRFLRGLVYDVPVTDVRTFVLAAVALGITACIAALVPARRAARIDPASAIRFD
jgi:macrolide transport system ATP-binding/permease protein